MDEFADRLNAVFAAFLQPEAGHGRRREEWPNATVVRVATELGPPSEKPVLTRQYLSMLRSGERTQPSLRAANAIAVAFCELARRAEVDCEPAVILSYLAGEHSRPDGQTPDAQQVHDLLAGVHPMGHPEVPVSARLADDAGPDTLRDIEALIDRLSQQDAESTRQRLARLLRLRATGQSGGDTHS